MYAPYQVATWADIPDGNKEPTGLWVNNYTGFESIGYDSKLGDIRRSRTSPIPSTRARSPSTATRSRRPPGSTASSSPPWRTAAQPTTSRRASTSSRSWPTSGNLLPVDPTDASVASGQTPIVIDWTYNQGGLIDVAQAEGHRPGRPSIPSDAPPVAAFYNSSINKDAAHPAAARCWMEYIFSDAGQNTWLKGFALPVRLARDADGRNRSTQAALAALNAPVDRHPCS